MSEIQLIHMALLAEKRLEIEEEKHRKLRGEAYADFLLRHRLDQGERQPTFAQMGKSILSRIVKNARKPQPNYPCCVQEG